MKPGFKIGRDAGQPRRLRHLVVIASGMAVGLRYCRLAQRDEQNGFPYTAAFEWRRAAELLRPFGRLAGHCWQEWERIMEMPRHLASPFAADGPAILLAPLPEPSIDGATVRATPRRRFACPARFAVSCWQRLRAH